MDDAFIVVMLNLYMLTHLDGFVGFCFRCVFRIPTDTAIFPIGLVRFRPSDYVPTVSVPVYPVFVFVRLRKCESENGRGVFRPFPSVFTPTLTYVFG